MPPQSRAQRLPLPPLPSAKWAYFFDIDGTLVELAETPDRVNVESDLAPLIERLHKRTNGAVALITGRSIEDTDSFFPVACMPIAGQHGLELRDAQGQMFRQSIRTESLDMVRQEINTAIKLHPELFAEFKGLCIALHYRTAPRLGGYANRLMRTLQARFAPDFAILRGKKIVELKPAGRDKGIAIRELMETPPFAGRLPVFLGDDETDEFGFEAVNEMGGHSIKIGKGRTVARWRLKDVAAVKDWLKRGDSGT